MTHPRPLPSTTAAPARARRGFTLIELMITVAVVALLASLAYPAYTGSMLKARRAEGRTALMELLQQQERFLTQSGSYMTFAAGATGANGTVNPAVAGQNIPFKTTSGNAPPEAAYRLSAAVCTPASGPALARNECVLLTAMPNNSDPEFGNLTLTSTGAKGCSTNNPKCWR